MKSSTQHSFFPSTLLFTILMILGLGCLLGPVSLAILYDEYVNELVAYPIAFAGFLFMFAGILVSCYYDERIDKYFSKNK